MSLNPFSKIVSSTNAATRARHTYRRRSFEQLETRRLLAVEGSVFEISRSFNTVGTVGALTSTIHWGDGTSSPGTVVNSQPSSPLRVRFVYSGNDTFFSGANIGRRAILQAAADSIVERLSDDLTAISPGGLLQWTARTINPSNGQTLRVPGLSVAANELVVYVGARELGGSKVGEGAPGTYEFPAVNNVTQEQINQILAFRENVIGRGESNVDGSAPTDFATWGGTLAFDSNTNFHFGLSDSGLDDNEVDFYSVASHELLHILGFGVELTGATSSWEHLIRNGTYSGSKGNAAYPGSATVPLDPDGHHLSESAAFNGEPLLMNPEISRGKRFQVTPVDIAILDDIGWDVPQNTATVTASHVYPDNGNYHYEIVLSGSRAGRLTHTQTANITNVAPSLQVVGDQSVRVGQTLSITDIGRISDPGFRNNAGDPPTVETFEYSVNWRDGSTIDRGTATIDRHGTSNTSDTTLASFDASHVYTRAGTYSVSVIATDDDGGTTSASVSVHVIQQPQLTLSLDKTVVAESDGPGAARLTVSRSGPATDSAQTISLSSSDDSEARLPSTLTIAAGQTSATVMIEAVDDALLDGTQQVVISASGASLLGGEATLNVSDHETLSASVTRTEIVENEGGLASLVIRRNNTDNSDALTVAIAGAQSQIDIDNVVTIPASQPQIAIPIQPINDDEPEAPVELTFSLTASGYISPAEAQLLLVDDEQPLFQNPANPFDIDADGETTTSDAFRAINELSRRQGETVDLDPTSTQPNGIFFDTNGDYRLTPLDALIVINHLNRLGIQGQSIVAEPENVSDAMRFSTPAISANDDDDDTLVVRDHVFSQLAPNEQR